MAKDSIALIGFMASGKTTIGIELVKYLGEDYTFIETDQIIVQDIGKSIPEIFAEEGESKFREYESSICEKVSKLHKVIISCGGGVVLHNINIENLKKNCHIVLLKAPLDEIYKRSIKNGKHKRPIINKGDLKTEIEKVLNFRRPYYEKAAEVIIETTNRKIEDIVSEIVIKTQLKT
ncbi:MAG: shikimate kinase [Promethearchaeota archaeon]|nr:MAG: shikimate kinase [Candidatus Lokiarchaeota archaeon]